MPSDFPRSPKLLKGALVVYESQFLGPVPNVVAFQYNPEQLGAARQKDWQRQIQELLPSYPM
jgi:hypothetical protein